MTVVEELDAAIARARGERPGVTDGPWRARRWFGDDQVVDADNEVIVRGAAVDADPDHIAAWADPEVTDATVAVWQALRDDLVKRQRYHRAGTEPGLIPTETAVLAQVRTYMRGQS